MSVSVVEGRVIGGSRRQTAQPPVEVGDLEVGDLEVGDLEVGDLEVGDLEVGDLEVGDLEVGARDVGLALVVAAQAPVSSLAAKQLLDEPSLGQGHEAPLFFIPMHDVERPAQLLLHLRLELLAGKARIGEDGLQVPAPRALLGLDEHRQGTSAFIRISRQNHRFEQVAAHVAQLDALAPVDLFGPVIAPAQARPLRPLFRWF